MPDPTADERRLRARLKRLWASIKNASTSNQSSRRGARILASVLHTTESASGTLWQIVRYFQTDGVDASSSYVIADRPARQGDEFVPVVRVVPENMKPWTQLSANPVAVSYEMIGRASRTRREWLANHREQIRTVAALAAEDALQYDLPVRHGLPGQLGHVDLTKYGYPQSHTDPGQGFPWDVFLEDVQRYYDMGKGHGVPPVVTVPGPMKGRPADAPRRIPRWAHRLHAWQLSDDPDKGPRPKIQTKTGTLPSWYYPWRRWKLGLGGVDHH